MVSAKVRRPSQAPPPNVNLYCEQCDSQIGIFDNEWIRLTASYARSKERATHFGTDVGQKTREIPAPSVYRAVEGCHMAEVFCRKCSNSVGQYCKSAGDADKQYLVGSYFYKLSRTYLRDAQTSHKVDFSFGFGGESVIPVARSAATPRLSLPVAGRWSQTPAQNDGSPGAFFARQSVARGSQNSATSKSSPQHDNGVVARLAELERRLARYENVQTPEASQTSPALDRNTDESSNQMEYEREQTEDTGVSDRFDTLQNSMTAMQHSIQQLCSEMRADRLARHSDTAILKKLQVMVNNDTHEGPKDEEMLALREENTALRRRMALVASAMDLAAANSSSSNVVPAVSEATPPNLTLGKRKRNDEHIGRTSSYMTPSQDVREQQGLMPPEQFNGLSTPVSRGFKNAHQNVNMEDTTQEHDGSMVVIAHEEAYTMDKNSSESENVPSTQDHLRENGTHYTSTSKNYREIITNDTVRSRVSGAMTGSGISAANSPDLFDLQADEPINFSDEEPNNIRDSLVPDTESGIGNNDITNSESRVTTPLLQMEAPSVATNATPPIETVLTLPQHEMESNSASPVETPQPAPRGGRRRVTEPLPHHVRSTALSVTPAAASARRPRLSSKRHFGGGIEHATIVTPDDIKVRIENQGKPRVYKERVQTTEKLLRQELEDLGLSDWIDKDKHSAEYRKVVQDARARQREAKKQLVLASKGLKTIQPPDATNDATVPAPDAAVESSTLPDQAPSQAIDLNPNLPEAVQPLADGSTTPDNQQSDVPEPVSAPLREAMNKQGKKPKSPEVVNKSPLVEGNSSAAGVMTRRQQREDEIRKRDQLAMEAMEREEMA